MTTRRAFLQAGSLGAVGLNLPRLLEASERTGGGGPDRSCIVIFNVGGPSQLDTFDPKPDAPSEIRGPYRPIATAVPGTWISELFPLHARIADRFSLVRSCRHGAPAAHDAGWQIMQTGRYFTRGLETPHFGAAASFALGDRDRSAAFAVVPEPMGRGGGNLPNGQSAGFLGRGYDPWTPIEVTGGGSWRGAADDAIRRLESIAERRPPDRHFDRAFRMVANERALAAWNVAAERDSVRRRYGVTRFGQSCLAARRLVEAGVRFVTINTFPTVFDEPTWDVHGFAPFTTMDAMRSTVAPMVDQATSALIEDLDQRGLLDTTLVCSVAEFGRTPRINAAGGRDHWPQCFTCAFAGGGVSGGRVVGRSDAVAGEPVERPVEPPDLAATIFWSLGIDPRLELPGPDGRSVPLVDSPHAPVWELFGA